MNINESPSRADYLPLGSSRHPRAAFSPTPLALSTRSTEASVRVFCVATTVSLFVLTALFATYTLTCTQGFKEDPDNRAKCWDYGGIFLLVAIGAIFCANLVVCCGVSLHQNRRATPLPQMLPV